MFGSVADSPIPEIPVPEFSGELNEHESRSNSHQPIPHGVLFTKIVECKPIDNQKQKAGSNDE
jgi:hypothetical protein